jgi:hypothetical protein
LSQLSKNESAAWTGGKPKSDWSGIEDDPQTYASPNQLRPVSANAAQKSYNHRNTGPTDKYKRGDDLADFQTLVWDHLKDTGLDTVAYLRDPSDPSRMLSVVKEHSRFTLATAKELSHEQAKLYDAFDTANDGSARKFVLDSISKDLSKHVSERLLENPTFAEVWLQFIKTIQSTSLERFDVLIAKIKGRKPAQYPGENLETLASDYRRDALELSTAGHYEHKLTLDMANGFLLAGGPDNEDFRSRLRGKAQNLETALLKVAHQDKASKDQYMNDHDFSFMDICRAAEDAYRRQYDNGKWPPAQHARDSKTVPTSFGANAVFPSTPPSGSASDGPFPGNCYSCGKPGHLSRNCPSPKTANGSSEDKRHSRTNQNHPPSEWKTTPPAAGAPTTKEMHGKTFHWCAKCKRYTITHTTEGHTGKPPDKVVNFASLAQDYSAWNVSFDMNTLVEDKWNLIALPLVALVRDQVQRLIRTVESLCTPHVHSTVFDREGGETANTAHQPIPGNGHHNLGSTRLTHKHGQASTKVATMPIIWDSGASISLSFNQADFVGVMKPVSKQTRHQGIAKGLSVEGRGHVLWPMLDTNGQLRLLKVPALYVPNCPVRLLSTTSLLQTYNGESIELLATQMRLSGLASDPTRGAVIATVNSRDNLPTTTSYSYDDVEAVPQALFVAIDLTNEANTNLSTPEMEWLHCYARLCHLLFRNIQFLIRSDIPSQTESTRRDDWFTAVSSVSDTLPDFHSHEWSPSFGDSVYRYPFDYDDVADDLDLMVPPASANADHVTRAMVHSLTRPCRSAVLRLRLTRCHT